MSDLTHLHLAVNAKIGPDFEELSKGKAQQLVDRLMRITDMKPLGPLNWSDAVDLDFPGQSFVQMITTSHCSLHYFSDTREIYFDLYSCKNFDPQKVVNLLDDVFDVREWHGMLYSRGTDSEPVMQQISSKSLKMKVTARARN
jgi:S-adenosylmethionine/arginine decarboxylase-like enzyme